MIDMASRKPRTVNPLELALALAFLTIAGAGLALQITHVARPLGSFVILLGTGGNTVVIMRNAGRVHRAEDAERARYKAES